MGSLGQAYRFAKLAVGGVGAAIAGAMLIGTGEPQAIVSGIGTLFVSAVLFAFLGWLTYQRLTKDETVEEPPKIENRTRVFWLGIAIALIPALLYYYLRYAMPRFDPKAALFISVPVLLAGLGCIGVSFWLPNDNR